MGETQDPGPADGEGPASRGGPGALSRLLIELVHAPAEELATAWQEALAPGEKVGRYQVREEIGRGGFGSVYEVFDPELGRVVALKALKPGRTRRELGEDWIKKEAEAVARLDHPAIITIHDVGTCPAGAYLVMERLQGETLAKRLAKGPLAPAEALSVALEMARALAHAHSRGVLHRDLKPANVFLTGDGRVKLLDFGLAHLLGSPGSDGAGTPAYMAPEQARGEPVDERSDVYAAGLVLCEMLTGERPLVPGAPPALPRAIPRPFARAISAALAAYPAGRPRDGAAWLGLLQAAGEALERPRKRLRTGLFGGAGLLFGIALALFVWFGLFRPDRSTVAVGDFTNETGDADLDSVAGLVITKLEQSKQLKVLTRGRLLDILGQLGKGRVDRIDEPLALAAGREANVRALLVGTIRKLGASYVVDLRSIDPLRDELLFTATDRASSKEGIFDLVDRLAALARKELGVGGGTEAPTQRQVASITTSNPKAWELLSRSRQAWDLVHWKEAVALSREALQVDPEFALAHYQLALLFLIRDEGSDDESADARLQIEAAERVADRLPEKERLGLRAMRAAVDGRWEEAKRLQLQLAEAHPLDKEALARAAELLFMMGEFREATPWAERSVALDPGYRRGIYFWSRSMLDSGRSEQVVPLNLRVATTFDDKEIVADAAQGLLAAGREAEAVAAFRRLGTLAPGTWWSCWPHPYYLGYLLYTGQLTRAEAELRQAIAERGPQAGKPDQCFAFLQGALVRPLLFQGRLVEASAAEARFQLLRQQLGEPGGKNDRGRRKERAVATGQLDLLRAVVQEAAATPVMENPESARDLLGTLAISGDLAGAGRLAVEARARHGVMWKENRLARRAVTGNTSIHVLDWLTSVGQGDLAAAEAGFREGARDEDVAERASGLALLAELARTRGDCAEVVKHLEAVRALPYYAEMVPFSSRFAAPRLQTLALCYERLGDTARARQRNDELLRRWARADADLPLLAEAKALQARLAAR
jgi:eukaryotic-like serine/threonine-protein kinase